MKKIIKGVLFWIWSLTWGLPITLCGIVVSLALLITGHKPYIYKASIYFKVGKGWGGFELGPFFVVSESCGNHVIFHEWGHGIQNLIVGPLMLPLISIPSAIRYWYRELKYYKKGKVPPTLYDSIWFEKWATNLGYKYAEYDYKQFESR